MARLVLAATSIVFAAYALVLGVARALTPVEALAASAANTIPTVVFGILAYRLIGGLLVGRSLWVQTAGHVLIGGSFALMTYWLLMVALGLLNGASIVEFTVQPFPARASAWQLLQNVTIYGIIAALAYHHESERVTVTLSGPAQDELEQSSRYFTRIGDDIRPIDVASIVSIAGADDYAEVATLTARHLVRMTLSDFERSLDQAKFIRVHRSRIVNLERIERAEPAGGGRLLLHMDNGDVIPASRGGSKLLRDRVI